MSNNLGSTVTPPPASGRRLLEIEALSNRFFIHLLSEKLVIVARKLSMTPNMLSFLGMFSGVLAGLSYYFYVQALWSPSPLTFKEELLVFLGFALMISWHICDGADGQLARLTNQTSKSGKIIDGMCDYACFIAVYTGVGLACVPHDGNWIYAAGFLAGGCHAIQAASYELQREEYAYWAYGRGELPLTLTTVKKNGPLSWLNRAYQLLQAMAAGKTAYFQRELAKYLSTHQENGRETIAQHYREIFPPLIRRWSILSGNTRTLMIFVFCLFHYPAGYFIFEIIVLSLYSVLMHLQLQQKQEQLLNRLI